ncbi:hypothetical protein SynSYN20_02929 [Synechococcus sp. SYN20]|nr:hypothetical protein SynSYN20_02929 [Synechococcus sp. SYN20]
MLRWCIWLDLKEYLLLPVHQPALTVEFSFIGLNQAAAAKADHSGEIAH